MPSPLGVKTSGTCNPDSTIVMFTESVKVQNAFEIRTFTL